MKEGSHENESCSDLSRHSVAINMLYCQKRIEYGNRFHHSFRSM